MDLKLNADGDLDIVNGDLNTVNGDDELAQSVKIIVQTRLLEFEPADEMGVDPENMFGKRVSKEYLATDIADAITEQEPRVASVLSVELSDLDSDRTADLKIVYLKREDESQQQTLETEVSLDD